MSDLFGEPLIPGLAYRPEFITADEERDLLERLSAEELAPFRFHG